MKMTYCVALAFLVLAGVQDLRTRTVSRYLLLLGAAAALAVVVCMGIQGWADVIPRLLAALPGALLLALAWMTQGQIGTGDGICVMITGLLVGTPMIYLVLMASLVFSSIWAAGLLVTRRGTRHSRMPWLPFLAAGMAVSMWIQGGA